MARKAEKPLAPVLARLMLAYGADKLEDLAARSGRPLATLRTWNKRDAVPASECVELSEETGLSLDWLILGRHIFPEDRPFHFDPKGSLVSPEGWGIDHQLPKPRQGDQAGDVVMLNKYDAVGSCGHGSWVESAAVIDQVPFARAWLVREGLSPDSTVVITTRGDSMSPLIRPGAEVLVDRSKRDPRMGGVFAFTYQGELLIKYLQLTEHGLRMSSENTEKFAPRLFTPEESAEVVIEGKIFVLISRV